MPAAIFLLALVPRLLFFSELRQAPTFARPEGGDSIFYDRIASGEPGPQRAYFHSPLYRWYLTAIYSTCGRDLGLVRLLQHLLGALTAALVCLLTLRLFRRPLPAAVAGLIPAYYGPAIFYEGQLLPDAILPLLLVLNALALLRYVRRGRPADGLWLGLASGLCALARPTSLIWLPVALLWALWRQRRNLALTWRKEGLLLLTTLLVIAPATVRNYQVERDRVLISANLGLNLYIGNNPNARGSYNLPAGLWFQPGDPQADFSGVKAASRELGYTPSSSQLSRWWTHKALRYLANHPWRAVELTLLKARLWLNDYEMPQLYNYYGYAEVAPLLGVLPSSGPFIVLGLTGLLWLLVQSKRAGPRLLAVCLLLFTGSFLPFFVVGRYRAPWVVLLAPFAAWGLWQLGRALQQRRWQRAGVWAASYLTLAVISFWPVPHRPSLAPQRYAFANAAAAAGDLREALRWYRLTQAADARYLQVSAELGQTLLRLGRLQEAERSLLRAAAEDPGSAEVQHVLALVHQAAGRPEQAASALLAALERKPALTAAWIQLGELRLAQGEPQQAALAFEAALALSRRTDPWLERARRGWARAQVRLPQAPLNTDPK